MKSDAGSHGGPNKVNFKEFVAMQKMFSLIAFKLVKFVRSAAFKSRFRGEAWFEGLIQKVRGKTKSAYFIIFKI